MFIVEKKKERKEKVNNKKDFYFFAYGVFYPLFQKLESNDQGLVVHSTLSLTSSLRGQLVKCFTTL